MLTVEVRWRLAPTVGQPPDPALRRHAASHLATALGLGFLLAMAACRQLPAELSASTLLTDGRSIASLSENTVATAVLVFDPADCVTCARTLSEWTYAHQSDPARVKLVLSRSPNDMERRLLATLRISPTGVLAQESQQTERFSPKAFLFVNARLSQLDTEDFSTSAASSPILEQFRAVTGPPR